MEDDKKLTLDRQYTYQIQVPGELDESWSDWDGQMTVTVERKGGKTPVTTLTGNIDQAALHSILRRLYSLGLPLISVICLECSTESCQECCGTETDRGDAPHQDRSKPRRRYDK